MSLSRGDRVAQITRPESDETSQIAKSKARACERASEASSRKKSAHSECEVGRAYKRATACTTFAVERRRSASLNTARAACERREQVCRKLRRADAARPLVSPRRTTGGSYGATSVAGNQRWAGAKVGFSTHVKRTECGECQRL